MRKFFDDGVICRPLNFQVDHRAATGQLKPGIFRQPFAVNAGAVEIRAIGALQILHPPSITVKNNLRMTRAYERIVELNITRFAATERKAALKALLAHVCHAFFDAHQHRLRRAQNGSRIPPQRDSFLKRPGRELVPMVTEQETAPAFRYVFGSTTYDFSARTHVMGILNVTPDHLDRYASIDDYALTKARIFDGLSAHSLALLSAKDPFMPMLLERVPAVADRKLVDGPEPPRLAEHDGALELRVGEFYRRELVPLAGRHNAVNALFALAAARHLDVPREACERALAEFRALPHRMNPIADRHGIRYYDDSKATNPHAALAAVAGLHGAVLVAGGRSKGVDLSPLAAATPSLAGVVVLGEAAEELAELFEGRVPISRVSSIEEAVAQAFRMASPGGAVVLAPACASPTDTRLPPELPLPHTGRVPMEGSRNDQGARGTLADKTRAAREALDAHEQAGQGELLLGQLRPDRHDHTARLARPAWSACPAPGGPVHWPDRSGAGSRARCGPSWSSGGTHSSIVSQ